MGKYYRKKISLSSSFAPEKLFLAEGLAEALFLEKLLTTWNVPENRYCIFCIEGVDNLETKLKLIAEEQNFPLVKSVGVMVDADRNYQKRLAAIVKLFQKIGFIHSSVNVDANGLAVSEDRRLGVFISPGSGNLGRIESMVIVELADTRIWNPLSAFKAACQDILSREISEKAICQVYCSVMRDDICGTGRAFECGVFDQSHAVYRPVVDLFSAL